MITISTELEEHYASETTTLASIWQITLRDNTILRFTNHDADITYLSNTYVSVAAYDSTDVQTNAGLAVNNLEVSGYIIAPYISQDDINAGLWDSAQIVIREVNYTDLSMGSRLIRSGTIGEITHDGRAFNAELRGKTQLLQRSIGSITSASCRYDLGDSKCTKDLTDYTVSGATITSVTSASIFVASDLTSATVRLTPSSTGAPTLNYFQGGKLTWLTGNNAGTVSEVDEYDNVTGELTIVKGTYYSIQVGDTFNIVTGCNKLLKTGPGAYLGDCKIKFGNVVNFGGEPEMPGEESQRIGGR
jgi:uncharacterized phage protein (TIGR02218 family)